MSDRSLDGKVAFVAGASRGIGRAIAQALAREGAAVAVAARSEKAGSVPGTIGSVAKSIRGEGGVAHPVRCDVTDESSVDAAIASTVDTFGGIDILVANAGVMWLGPTLETPLKRWELCLRVNLTGTFLVTKAALPHVMKRGSGSLIAITTSGVQMTELGSNAYWVSKAGVERYYRGLAEELADHRIAVNCLAPRKVVRTEGWVAATGDAALPDEMLEPESAIAEAAVVLAGQDASGITGSVQYSLDLIGEAS